MEKSVPKTKVFILIAAKVLKSFGQLPINIGTRVRFS